MNWTNLKLKVYDKEKVTLAYLFAEMISRGLCVAFESEDFGSDINCLRKSQCLWASQLFACTPGGGGHLWVSFS